MPIASKRARAVTAASLKLGLKLGLIALGLITLGLVAPATAGAALAVSPSYQDVMAMQARQKAPWFAVAVRYADKLPGSRGEAGGYGVKDRVMPRGDGGPTPESSRVHGLIPFLIFGGLLLLAGLAYAVRHRRRRFVPILEGTGPRRIDPSLPAGPA